jgi:hypothetical protein
MEPNALIGFLPLILLVSTVAVLAIPYWRICGRTGLHRALVAILFIPVVGWALLAWIIAFSDWPLVPKLHQPKPGDFR